MTSAETTTALDAMPYLDESAVCEHSNHNRLGWGHHHNGPATHYVAVIHNCQKNPAQGHVYPVCTPFAQYTASMGDQPWMCPQCHDVDDGARMVRVVASIKGES